MMKVVSMVMSRTNDVEAGLGSVGERAGSNFSQERAMMQRINERASEQTQRAGTDGQRRFDGDLARQHSQRGSNPLLRWAL